MSVSQKEKSIHSETKGYPSGLQYQTAPAPSSVRFLEKMLLPFGINLFPRSIRNPHVNRCRTAADVFEETFVKSYWKASDHEDSSASGPGSSRRYTTRYLARLQIVLRDLQISSLLDAPCGDLHWMADLARSGEWQYTGGDISPSLVAHVCATHPGLDVRLLDITRDPLPVADLWHCRDCLFHMSYRDIAAALERFVESRIPYLLVTTHRAKLAHRNLDIDTGDFRLLDLTREPVRLPRAVLYIPDYRPMCDFPRYVGLWRREQIEDSLARFISAIQ
jgi:hypothetical protein